jgi:hypothetical protein
MGFSDSLKQVVDALADLFWNRLVVFHERGADREQLRQLHCLVQVRGGIWLGRLTFFGLHVILEEALHEHDDLALEIGAVVETLPSPL